MKKQLIIINSSIIGAAVLGVGIWHFIEYDAWARMDAAQKEFGKKYVAPFLQKLGIDVELEEENGNEGAEQPDGGSGSDGNGGSGSDGNGGSGSDGNGGSGSDSNGGSGSDGNGGSGSDGNGGSGNEEVVITPLSAPALKNHGPHFSWGEVENAKLYEITINGKQKHLTVKTEFIWQDYDGGGTVTVKAVGDGALYSDSADSNKVILPTLGKGSAYAEFTVGNEDIYITAGMDKVRLTGATGNTTNAHVYINQRTSHLLIELDNVHCRHLGVIGNSTALITVRVIGDSVSGFVGDRGANGADGKDGTGMGIPGVSAPGQGGTGGTGGTAGVLPNVIFIGSQSVGFFGGDGGTGGKGGDHAPLNTVAGKGGTGGTGGIGLISADCRVALIEGATLECGGGFAGKGGATGQYKYPNHAEEGENGRDGAAFSGTRKDLGEQEYVRTVKYTLTAPTLTVCGSYISWTAVDGAEYYEVRIGNRVIKTEKTAIDWRGFREGGIITVAPFATDSEGAINSATPTVYEAPTYPAAGERVEYIVGITTAFEDIRIPASVNYCRISAVNITPGSPDELFFPSVYIEKRSTPLHIVLDSVLLKYIGNESGALNPDSTRDSLVTLEIAGDGASVMGGVFDYLLVTGNSALEISTRDEGVKALFEDALHDLIVTEFYYVHREGCSVRLRVDDTQLTDDKVKGNISEYETVE